MQNAQSISNCSRSIASTLTNAAVAAGVAASPALLANNKPGSGSVETTSAWLIRRRSPVNSHWCH